MAMADGRPWQRPRTALPQDDDDGNGVGADGAAVAKGAAAPSRWLACTHRAGLLGVAAFDQLSNELSVLQVEDDSSGPCAFQMLQYIKLQVDPQVIILSATADPALVEAARLPAAAATGAAALDAGAAAAEEVTIQLQRPSMFIFHKALHMVGAVQVREAAGRPASAASAHVDLTAQQQVAALGALVAVLLQLQDEDQQQQGSLADEAGRPVLVVDALREMSLDGHLVVDGPTLAALDIFREEEHPSAMGIGASKEGVSVFGLLQRCVTGMGRRLLRHWFLRPVVHLPVITDRHNALELLVASGTTNDALRAAMKKLQDLPRLLARLRLSQARPQLQTFKQLHDSVNQLLALRAMLAVLAPAAAAAAAAASTASGPPQQQSTFQEEHQAAADEDGWLHDSFWANGAADAGRAPAAAASGGLFSASGGQAFDDAGAAGGLFFSSPSAAAGGLLHRRPAASAAAFDAAQQDGAPQAGAAEGGGWDRLHIVGKLLSAIGPQLSPCCSLISDVLDLSGGALEGRLVQPGVCAPLDGLRATLDELPGLLTQVVEQELLRVPAHISRRYSRQLWSIVYIPQVGFLMSVTGGRLSEELAELLHDYQLAFMGEDAPVTMAPEAGGPFTTEGADPSGALADAAAAAAAAAAGAGGDVLDRGCAYYTCETTSQLNSRFGDLQHKIQDLEASICTELIKRLLQHGPALSSASAAVAELDCLCSFAAAARELGYCRPTLVRESVIAIEGGRHPLAELLAPGRFIDNDTHLGSAAGGGGQAAGPEEQQQQHPRMLLITGPNMSGKSVYMKQVALLTYMAHIGSFVPARSAVIGLADRILARLPGMESVARHTSSFMADLGQVANILTRATPRSLVLLDEFGKGTLTSDGVGLMAALLRHYAAGQPEPPLLLACTHFSELLEPGILPQSPQLGLCTMQVLVDGGSDGGDGDGAAGGGHGVPEDAGGPAAWEREHVFLYKLLPGVVAASYGLHCARLCGVDRSILMRAAGVQALLSARRPVGRLQVPQLEARDAECWTLVQGLAALDVAQAGAGGRRGGAAAAAAQVRRLLAAVVRAELGDG